MRKAADIFYKIGRILTYVGIGVFAVLALCGIIITAVGASKKTIIVNFDLCIEMNINL